MRAQRLQSWQCSLIIVDTVFVPMFGFYLEQSVMEGRAERCADVIAYKVEKFINSAHLY